MDRVDVDDFNVVLWDSTYNGHSQTLRCHYRAAYAEHPSGTHINCAH